MSETEAKPEVEATAAAMEVDVKEESAVEVKAEELGPLPTVEGKSEEEVKELLEKAAKQIYFYFSDSNLPVDKYFFSLTCCNTEGWVPLKTILTFKRMKEFQEIGQPFVVYALKKKIQEEGKDPLVVLSADGDNVRRKRPLEPNATAWTRSAYVKGFGEDDVEGNKQEKIEKYFDQFGKINAVRMRRADLEEKGPSGKGKGKFKGSVFVEFAYEQDMKSFLAKETIPKFTEDGEEMSKMSKDEYVKMKAKEKGIPDSEIHRGGKTDAKQRDSGRKFNAFKEMDKAKKGISPSLAKIGDDVAVIGIRPGFSKGGEKNPKKRERDEDGEERDSKESRTEEPKPLTIEYKGVMLECDRHTGKIIDSSKVPFENNAAVKFINHGENGDWKDLKIRVSKIIENPFLAFPPGSKSGTIAKSDAAVITDDELTKLRDEKMPFGGAEVEWSRMDEEEQRSFWTTRANFQGKLAADKLNEAQQKGGRRDFKGGRGGGGRGRGGRGRGGRGGRGGGRGGHRDRGDRNRERENGNGNGANPASSLPPSLGTGA
ncbi:hypothetical protein I302_109066 [Kwoniella bestiolae CBS 10118]|uniref:Lupus La protein n=1 Tax=Kwoniella bestiolae CBS 10118 TaxID=1296100 RepID=A0A1B9FUW2_9TREE|nr:lupus La protein [Kwoniella bestiolae CBS 10118]OCF22560.1 lupus La protein [Kwoniella bestiolae CBS 10118]